MHDYGLLLKTVREGRDMTQEQASEKVGVSVDTWYAYEANRRLPPPETVNRICDALEAPWLAMYFLEAHSGSMKVLPNVTARALPTAVLTLLSRVLDFNEKCRIKELVSVAEDGVVDEFEQDLYDEIVEELDGIIEAALAVKFPMDAKKTVRMLAHPNGPVPDRSLRTIARVILAHRPKNVNTFPGWEVQLYDGLDVVFRGAGRSNCNGAAVPRD